MDVSHLVWRQCSSCAWRVSVPETTVGVYRSAQTREARTTWVRPEKKRPSAKGPTLVSLSASCHLRRRMRPPEMEARSPTEPCDPGNDVCPSCSVHQCEHRHPAALCDPEVVADGPRDSATAGSVVLTKTRPTRIGPSSHARESRSCADPSSTLRPLGMRCRFSGAPVRRPTRLSPGTSRSARGHAPWPGTWRSPHARRRSRRCHGDRGTT